MIRILGFVFLGIAVLGVFLPLLPTTPFVLLAAGCFAQSSERMHRWILNNETFGPMVRDWEDKRCISRRVKAIAITSMILVGGFSISIVVDNTSLRIAGVLLLAVGALVVLTIPTCKNRER